MLCLTLRPEDTLILRVPDSDGSLVEIRIFVKPHALRVKAAIDAPRDVEVLRDAVRKEVSYE